MDRPLSGWWCALGWVAASAVFVALTQLLGGISMVDDFESVFSTWAIAHGHLACAYAPGVSDSAPSRTPLYPLLSGGLAAVAHIGHRLPFPSSRALGPHCSVAITAMTDWSARAHALGPTLRLGYLGWLALMGGLVAMLRSVGRGRRIWEPVVLLLAACSPPVFMAVQFDFHPEDLLAMGLALGALASARRGRWGVAGLLLGLAFTSQQFVLLVIAPLLVLAPAPRRLRFAGGAIAAAALVVVPLVVTTSGRVITAFTGPGYQSVTQHTALSAPHLHGPLLYLLSRVLPIVLALMLARWTKRRLGPSALEAVPLTSLMALCLTFRLVFEVNLLGYYFMAVTVMLLLLTVSRGRGGVYLLAWLALVALAFYPLPWGHDPLTQGLPLWLWQSVLVTIAGVLAGGPLLSALRHPDRLARPSDPPYAGSAAPKRSTSKAS